MRSIEVPEFDGSVHELYKHRIGLSFDKIKQLSSGQELFDDLIISSFTFDPQSSNKGQLTVDDDGTKVTVKSRQGIYADIVME